MNVKSQPVGVNFLVFSMKKQQYNENRLKSNLLVEKDVFFFAEGLLNLNLICIMAPRYGEMGEWLKPHPC